MGIIIVNAQELQEVMQYINLVKIKFGSDNVWVVCPVLYSSDGEVDIIVDQEKTGYTADVGAKLIFKFQRYGFEYLVSGDVIDVKMSNPPTITVKYDIAQKYSNLRKFMRFDTDLNVIVKEIEKSPFESTVKNISRGGAMIIADKELELNSVIEIDITFNSGNRFNSIAKVMRKASYIDNHHGYGIQFVEVSDNDSKIINKEISKYEKEYLSTLSIFREYKNISDVYYDTKISIFSYDDDESYEIRESLIKLGAENFEVFHNFRFYFDFFVEESPKIIIIDANELSEDIYEIIEVVHSNFIGQTRIVLLLPIDCAEKISEGVLVPEEVVMLYKPLIYDEFEKEIIKYL